MTLFRKVVNFYRDPEYFSEVQKIAIPIIIQQFAFALLNMLNVVFVGQKGDTAVAAVGFAGQIYFLLNLIHFGIISGAAMFTAQFWGRRDVLNLRRVLGLCLMIAMGASLVFFSLSQFIPSELLHIYSKDEAVIALGVDYLRTFSWTFLFFAVTFSYSMVMRSTGDVKTPTTISVIALCISTLLAWALIPGPAILGIDPGMFGFPELGIQGAAVAAVIARAFECVTLITVTYIKKSPVAASLRELTDFDRAFIGRVIKPMLPVMLNELFWALGTTSYSVIYGHLGTGSFAAMNIVSTIDQLAFVIFMGLSNATSVLVGNRIGADKEEEAYTYAGRSLGLGMVGGILIGIMLQFVKTPILSLFKVSPEVIENASYIINVLALFAWIRVNNMIIVVGVLRAGGDTRFSLFLDGIIIWIVGVPMAYIGANIFHLPVYFVYLCAMSEETIKWILGLWRYRSRKWINNLAAQVSTGVESL